MNKLFLNFIDSQKLYQIIGNIHPAKFYYGKKDKQIYDSNNIFMNVSNFERIYIPAYTDSELNEYLPYKIFLKGKTNVKEAYELCIRKMRSGKFQCEYENQNRNLPCLAQLTADTEVEAKAKMIIYLKKQKLLNHEN